MMVRRNRKLLVVVTAVLMAAGCGGFGKVEQGIVVASDGSHLTLVLDSNPDDPTYDRVPAVVVAIPEDESQRGPTPAAGGLIALDTTANQAVVYDPATKGLLTIDFELVERTGDVYPDDQRVAAAGVPKVDPTAGTVNLYAPRTREIATIKPPAEYLSLTSDTWQAGDEVRYYYKDPAQALRMMNVSKTNIR